MSYHLSFEFFPPKTIDGKANLEKNALLLMAEAPQFFSVTFGAGGGTREGTIDAVKMLHEKTAIPVAPHLACVGSIREEIIAILQEYKALGVRRIVALRGDMPSGMGQAGDLKFASELVALIRETTQDHFHIEVAAYPECHPQAKNAESDILNFKKKVDAGANSAITQYFFNPDAYFYFLDHCAKHGIFIPITPGIMPITQFGRLQRFSDMCGAEIPRWIRCRLESYGDDILSQQSFGLEVVHHLCERLLAGGAPGLHFYTLNHAESSLALLKMFNNISTPKRPRIKTI
ncbi:MAG: methylenetetrahydrofolate reductase [NAD(P)H] [Gammaproteobacteria bacterium]|nr:methylenetetrahydrofolate reductase [NAD(P)H] [Gammaproteobacteria bacterium]